MTDNYDSKKLPGSMADPDEMKQEMHHLLMNILEQINLTEQEALVKGYFSDLTTTEMHTLQAIGLYDSPSMGETAQTLGVTTGTLTVSISRLVSKGYVVRERMPEDRRVVRLQLTRKGKLASRIYSKFHRLLVENLIAPLTEDEQRVLLDALRRVYTYVNDQFTKYQDRDPMPERERDLPEPEFPAAYRPGSASAGSKPDPSADGVSEGGSLNAKEAE